jgi:hypothetical protein
MKFNILFIVFILFFSQNTEGYAQVPEPMQEVQEQPALPAIPLDGEDVNEVNDEATLEEERNKPYKNPFEDSWQKYYSEDVKQKEFDKDAYQKATSGLDYTITEKKKEEQKKKDGEGKAKPNTSSNLSVSPGFLSLIQWLVIFGAVILIGYLVYKFADGGNVFARRSRRIDANSVELDLEKIEENLHVVELDPHIKQAIAQKQFGLAIRLYYLAIVKELSAKAVIVWKRDKTNRAYLNEMRDHVHFPNFKTMTGIYERVWYGDSPIDEPIFMMIEPAFKDLLKILRGA